MHQGKIKKSTETMNMEKNTCKKKSEFYVHELVNTFKHILFIIYNRSIICSQELIFMTLKCIEYNIDSVATAELK